MARKIKHPEHVNHERWLVSYADFITLLFAFFTVLYATAQTDQGKVNKLVGAVEKAFTAGIFSAGSDQLMFNDQGTARGSGLMDLGMNLREIESQLRLSIGKEGGGGGPPPGASRRRIDADPPSPAILFPRLRHPPLRSAGTPAAGRAHPAIDPSSASGGGAHGVHGRLGSNPVELGIVHGPGAVRSPLAGGAGHFPPVAFPWPVTRNFGPFEPRTDGRRTGPNRRVEIVILDEKPSFLGVP